MRVPVQVTVKVLCHVPELKTWNAEEVCSACCPPQAQGSCEE